MLYKFMAFCSRIAKLFYIDARLSQLKKVDHFLAPCFFCKTGQPLEIDFLLSAGLKVFMSGTLRCPFDYFSSCSAAYILVILTPKTCNAAFLVLPPHNLFVRSVNFLFSHSTVFQSFVKRMCFYIGLVNCSDVNFIDRIAF